MKFRSKYIWACPLTEKSCTINGIGGAVLLLQINKKFLFYLNINRRGTYLQTLFIVIMGRWN